MESEMGSGMGKYMEGYKAWRGEDEGRRKEKEGEKRRGRLKRRSRGTMK